MRGLLVTISSEDNQIQDFYRNVKQKTVRELLGQLGCKRKILSPYGAYFKGCTLTLNDKISKIQESQMDSEKGEIHIKIEPI